MTMCNRLALLAALAVAVAMFGGTVAKALPVAAQETGSISGVAIDDENGNGAIDAGEPGLAGWEVSISGTKAATTQVAADGSYVFEALPPGAYIVSLGAPIGTPDSSPWVPTLPGPDLIYEVTVEAGEKVENMDFAVKLLDEAAEFFANIMVDAAPALEGTLVQALIGDTVCDEYTVGVGPSSGRVGPIRHPHLQPYTVDIVVPSASEKEGCGTEGDTITFAIDGQPANETVPWHSGDQSTTTLTTGPSYATYAGVVTVDGEHVQGTTVKAYIGDTLCGEAEGLMGTYSVIVPPAELRPGCGEEGAIVRFTIGEADAEQIAQWAPGPHDLDLTASTATPSPTPTATPAASPTASPSPSPIATPAVVPGVGGGMTPSDGGAGWWPIVLAAGVVVALSGGGFALWALRRGRPG